MSDSNNIVDSDDRDGYTDAERDAGTLYHDGENDECEALEVDGPPNGEPMGRCSCGRPLYRSHFAGTIYHSTEE